MMSAIAAGALVGLSVAVPFGPVSLVCVQRSIVAGVRHGIVSGMGAATAHGLFFAAAAASAGIVTGALAEWPMLIRFASATVLVALGLRTAFRRSVMREGRRTGGQGAAYVGGLLLSLSNPMTILPYAALASAQIAVADGDPNHVPWMVAGDVFAVMAWYACLSSGAWLLRGRLAPQALRPLNILAGCVLVTFGILMGVR